MSGADATDLAEIERLLARIDDIVSQVKNRAIPLNASHGPGTYAVDAKLHALRRARAPLPDPHLIKRIVRQRRLRDRYFKKQLFADPAWDMLLELTIARVESRRVDVTTLTYAAAVPFTTALRWIGVMVEEGLFDSRPDDLDKRRRYISLSDYGAELVARYFDEMGNEAARLT